MEERVSNPYFTLDEKEELERLEIQARLFKQFDSEFYEEIKVKYPTLRVLDIGSNNGNLIMDRLGDAPNLECILGVEYDEETVQVANQNHASDKVRFYASDLEAEDFEEALISFMNDKGVTSFNVINCSLILLHLQNPENILRILRKYLEPGGTLLIKEIDDGLNLAYPDADGAFKRAIHIASYLETAGFRHSGRQLYTQLFDTGYKDIQIRKIGINTCGLSSDDRSALFETYFRFVKTDLEVMYKNYGTDCTIEGTRIREDYDWLLLTFKSLRRRFLEDYFFFNLGLMMITASV